MANESIQELEEILNTNSKGLTKLTSKKMFGCYALWVNENVFALVWKKGRLGVKLPVEDSYNKLMGVDGAEPWKAGPMTMAHWVLLPVDYHSKGAQVKKWLALAHKECSTLVKKKPATKKSKKK